MKLLVALTLPGLAAALRPTTRLPTTKPATRVAPPRGWALDTPVAAKSDRKTAAKVVPTGRKAGEVMLKPDFTLPAVVFGAGAALLNVPTYDLTLGPFLTAFGMILFVQAMRLRFVLDDDAMELKESKIWSGTDELRPSKSNYVVGGAQRWKLSSIVNYDVFPKWPVPVLFYFKETTSPKAKWNMNKIARTANAPKKLDRGVTPGLAHFMPVIVDHEVLFKELAKRGVKQVGGSAKHNPNVKKTK